MDWDDCTTIAEALNELYPKLSIDMGSLSNNELYEKIISLPDFTGEKPPEDAKYLSNTLDYIRYKWTAIRLPKAELKNDSAYI